MSWAVRSKFRAERQSMKKRVRKQRSCNRCSSNEMNLDDAAGMFVEVQTYGSSTSRSLTRTQMTDRDRVRPTITAAFRAFRC